MKIYAIALAASVLMSCSVSKKNKVVESTKTATVVSNIDSTEVYKKIDSLKISNIDSSFDNGIQLVFDNDSLIEYENDYEAAPIVKKLIKKIAMPFVYTIAGTNVVSDVPLKSATIRTSGKVSKVDIAHVSNIDTSTQVKKEVASTTTEKTIKSKEKISKRTPLFAWLIILAIVIIIVLYLLRRYGIL